MLQKALSFYEWVNFSFYVNATRVLSIQLSYLVASMILVIVKIAALIPDVKTCL